MLLVQFARVRWKYLRVIAEMIWYGSAVFDAISSMKYLRVCGDDGSFVFPPSESRSKYLRVRGDDIAFL